MIKTIEQAAGEYLDNKPNNDGFWDAFIKGADFIQQWYDIKIELPDEEAQDVVLIKTDNNCFATAYYHGEKSGFIVYGDDAYCDFGSVTHWKPIEYKLK